MFGFGKDSKELLADVKAAERWLAALTANDPLAMQHDVLAQLSRLADRNTHRTSAALEAVLRVDLRTKSLRKTLTAQYLEHASRSSRIENQLWQALFDLTQGFLLCYGAFAREISDHGHNNRWQALLPEVLARQIAHLGLDAKIRLFRYEQWIPAKWTELHGVFSLACTRQFERRSLVAGADGDATTIEQEYLIALMLQLVNAGNLTPRQVEWVYGELDDWCQPLRLSVEPSSVTSFFIDLGSRTGLRRRSPSPLEGRVLFLDTRPLHAILMQNVAMMEQKIKSQPLSQKTARRSEQLALVTKLAAQVDPEFKPFARRGERTAAAGTVDAIVGFAKISGYLRDEDRRPARESDSGQSFGGTMELATFGRTRNEKDRRQEQAKRRLATFAAPGGPWEVKDVSQTGFRLLAPMSVANSVTLGTLTALRPHGQHVWALGIVRRMRRLTIDRAEIGLQVIANGLTGVDLIEQRKPQDGDPSVDGDGTTINGRIFHGLFLSFKKREADRGVQSLIMPAVEYQPAKRFKLQTTDSTNAIRLGRLLEQQPDWVWTAVEPFDRSASTAGGPVPRG